MNEDELKAYLLQHIAADFTVAAEVKGHFLVDGSEVVIDYLMSPKPALRERGFAPNWFGVEVKSPDKEGAKKGLQVAWQAITYSQSEFEDSRVGQRIRPAFVLIYPPLSEFFGSQSEAYHIVCLLQKANVGYIEINHHKTQWRIKFGANAFFYSDTGLSKTPTISTKRHVGSWR